MFDQISPGCRSFHVQTTSSEGVAQLFVQVFAVCNENHSEVIQFWIQSQSTSQHNHCDGFSRTLCVPDNAALAASYIVYLFDAIYCGTNEKELLVSGNFFDAKVKDDKAVNEFQQTLWTTQIVKTSILFRDQSVSCAFKRGKVRLCQGEVAAE